MLEVIKLSIECRRDQIDCIQEEEVVTPGE